MGEAFVCDAVRTPIGRFGGALSTVRTDDLATIPIRTLLDRNPGIQLDLIDDVLMGCTNQAGEDNRNVARMAALLAGLPVDVPGATVNRLCGSGLEAIAQAARVIRNGEADLIIAGGVESMSRAPFVIPKPETAFSRDARIYDSTIGWRFVNAKMQKLYGIESMPETGENLARERRISRQDQDAFAYRSQMRARRAQESKRFAQELVAVPARRGRETFTVERDEHPRSDTTLEGLAKLNPLFGPDSTVTAGNSSGINDGAAAVLVASEDGLKRHGLTPRMRCLGAAVAGVPPRIMGIGPVPATRKLLARTKLALADFDIIELNEAFASQSLAVLRDLGLPDDAAHVNPNGGAIALGHPLGMSGARLATTALYELANRKARLALVTMCIGVGQGIAAAFERV